MVTCGLLLMLLGGLLGTYFSALILLPASFIALGMVFVCGVTAGLSPMAAVVGLFVMGACLQGGYLASLVGRELLRGAITNSRGRRSLKDRAAGAVTSPQHQM